MKIQAALIVTVIAAIQLVVPNEAIAEDHEKAVLITGATSGIGLMTTKHLADSGYFVYAGARKQADIDALNKIDNVMAVRLDVTIQEDIDKAVALIESEGRGLWGIVNNAGVNVIDPLIEADESDLEFLFDVNVYGVFRVTKAFAPMVIDSQGRIVNISSIAGTLSGGLDGYGMYVMSKHALEAYTDQLAWEMRKFGVKVSAIEPGNFESQIGESRCKRMLTNQAKKTYAYYQEEMNYYLDSCRTLMEKGDTDGGATPEPVAEAIEHALFNDKPKEHYLVVADPFEAMITISKAFEELVHLNHDHPYQYSREQLIEMLDSEVAIIRGEKQRQMPGGQ
ncbi:MAG: SDR family NAD(P)-dependent oxidoreductase [Woeseiaceae bacterium]|nr:SDR family NAD(P)-dependent oxidoreductase [Woeseiaceae bacterium]